MNELISPARAPAVSRRTLAVSPFAFILLALAVGSLALAAPPTCTFVSLATGPPNVVTFSVQDPDTGLLSIIVTHADNFIVVIPPFPPGALNVIITATQIDSSKVSSVTLKVMTKSATSEAVR